MARPTCPECKQRFRAIAYHKYNRVYYRSTCETCQRKKKGLKSRTPAWQTAGYKKKATCDKCSFKAKRNGQLRVYHVDGNLNNSSIFNLKTICLNCAEEIRLSDFPWKPGDLEPDR